jgi:hypothetical protein
LIQITFNFYFSQISSRTPPQNSWVSASILFVFIEACIFRFRTSYLMVKWALNANESEIFNSSFFSLQFVMPLSRTPFLSLYFLLILVVDRFRKSSLSYSSLKPWILLSFRCKNSKEATNSPLFFLSSKTSCSRRGRS